MHHNCTNKELLDMLNVCPNIIERLKERNCPDLIDAYDALLFDYRMDFGTDAVYKGNTDVIAYWSYWYKIDGKKFEMNSDWGFKTKAEAQLEAVHATMYELRERIENESRPHTH